MNGQLAARPPHIIPVVGYVGEPEVRVQFQEFSFDCAYQVILLTYVGR